MRNTPYRLYALLAILLFTGSCIPYSQQTKALEPYLKQASPCFNCGVVLNGHVIRVLDGDTLEVSDQNQRTFRIRLQGIDAPEKSQAYGLQAKDFLTKLTLDRDVEIIWNEKDMYGRLIGKITLEEKDICLEMISAGLAWHFTRYEQNQSEEDRQLYKTTEKRVREQRKGLWANPNPQPPWEYRQQQRKNEKDHNFEFMSTNGTNNGSPKSDDQLVNLTVRQMEETSRVADLSDLSLILEIRRDGLDNDPRVYELLTRTYPNWLEEPDDSDGSNPTHVSIAIPTAVAYYQISYDHCRCQEDSPCIYCACKAAIFRATKDEEYRPTPRAI